ncbi:MAG: copper homeostasis protein CutC [Bacteroidales bacterium]|nr:copper homeostasis protein CutC [Bacteroidales bacterium]
MHVEICCNSVLSARNAKAGGAYRIELCQALGEGGTTPSAAAIEYCVQKLNLQTRVLIRPRGGNFVYDDEEMEVILNDIEIASSLGAHAVVFGFLTPEGDIDMYKTRMAVEKAIECGVGVTFHRAFDECRNPHEALEQIIECGCNKVLTSGCAPTAWEGREMLISLQKQADRRIGIIAASGITADNVHQLVWNTGLYEVHASLKHNVNGLICTDTDQVREFMYITDDFPNYPLFYFRRNEDL